MEKSDIEIYAKSDSVYLGQIGTFIRQHRINQNYTQNELAERAGMSRSTLIQLESGKPVNLISLIQALRALKKLQALKELEYIPQLSPLKLAKMEQQQRQRAGRKKNPSASKPQSEW
ncbi:transcriptional regulator, y4mF family [compost metagenome]